MSIKRRGYIIIQYCRSAFKSVAIILTIIIMILSQYTLVQYQDKHHNLMAINPLFKHNGHLLFENYGYILIYK